MPQADELFTVAEVAAMLKLNPQTIRNWIDRGELACVRIGPRRVRIKRSDLDRLIQPGYTGGRAARTPPNAEPGVWQGEVSPPDPPES